MAQAPAIRHRKSAGNSAKHARPPYVAVAFFIVKRRFSKPAFRIVEREPELALRAAWSACGPDRRLALARHLSPERAARAHPQLFAYFGLVFTTTGGPSCAAGREIPRTSKQPILYMITRTEIARRTDRGTFKISES